MGGRFKLFVYGTLKRGGVRWPYLSGEVYLGERRTRPRYELLDLGDYPGLVPAANGGRSIQGELYSVAGDLVPTLDAIEGAPELFAMGPVELADEPGPVLAYLYQPASTAAPYPSDRWVICPRP
jgi:gamma-glutamylcyclotransferase (GGCT)/AIG2-like uncharacterized protein YtfP